ncbi:uncharacterized protein PG998_000291 [Apiospora kogelbergensis]|uniref:Uncharacterized protein n=1 Tax=Apiospora kogelbergensis TaxID=1337665 RepID=A0AAW0QXQ5_9PEZI
MHSSSFFVFFGLLASLVSSVLATTLYRGDSRGPKTIKADGGFKAKGFTNPEGTLFEHVESQLKHPSRDPFISTTVSRSFAEKHTGKGFLYTLDSAKMGNAEIFNVAEEYKKADRKYGHADEEEFAVKHEIPWAAVTKVEQKNKEGQWKSLVLPTKRAIKFGDEDVFA